MSGEPREEAARLAAGLAAHARRAARRRVRRVPVASRREPVALAAARPIREPLAVEAAAGPSARTPAPGSAEPARAARAGGPIADAALVRERARAAGSWEELRADVALCHACGLCRTRTQTVFADGSAPARILFVGEAPGQSEDEQGVPFVGRAGALLTDIIEKGMKIPRREVVIANVLKCRPPDNRDPSPEEKATCTPWLDRQVELVDPEIVIALGRHAAGHLLQSDASMAKLRGRVHAFRGRKVVATYHPAYLLRSPDMKKECWKDIQLAMREIGLL